MPGKMGDHVVPFIVVFRWRNIWFVPEGMKDRFRGQFLWHEAEFYKWAYVIGQKAIIDLVDVREIVRNLPGSIFIVQPDFIVKNCVESYVLKTGCSLHFTQIAPVLVPQ